MTRTRQTTIGAATAAGAARFDAGQIEQTPITAQGRGGRFRQNLNRFGAFAGLTETVCTGFASITVRWLAILTPGESRSQGGRPAAKFSAEKLSLSWSDHPATGYFSSAEIGAMDIDAARPSTDHSRIAATVCGLLSPITTTEPSCAARNAARSR